MPKSPHPITIEESINLKFVNDAQISPDGKLVAFTVGDMFKLDTQHPKSQVWLADANGARAFTTGPRADNTPRWSPDGAMLAFLSDRIEDGKPQIYLISLDGSEARALTDVNGDVLDLQWSHDGKRIAFLMEDAETDDEKKRKESKDDAIEFEKHPKFARVWTVDVASGKLLQVTQGDVHVWEYDWSPSDREFVLLVSDAPFEYEWYRPRIARVLAEGGAAASRAFGKSTSNRKLRRDDAARKAHRIFTPRGSKQLALARWSPNGNQIAFISCIWSDRGVVSGDIWLMDADGSNARNLTVNTPRDYSEFYWTPDGQSLIVMGYESGDAAIGMLDVRTGEYRCLWRGEAGFAAGNWQHFTMSKNQSTIAVVREDPINPPNVWIANIKKTGLMWKQVSHVNPQTSEFKLGETEKIFWKSSDDTTMQGYIVKPIGYRVGKRYPMVTWVHGGPAGNHAARYYAMRSRGQFLAAQGILVFLPNPRGSVGWGTKFTESNVGDLGGMDWQDIETGIDHCVSQGLADEEHLGIAGWSYGGFMAAWGITQTNRFKAAMVGAAITNWLSFHGTSNLAVWDQIANDASPYEGGMQNAYDKFSPMNFVSRVKTPTLIVHGEIDPYVPVGQAYEYYRALKDLSVPVDLVVYPRESHGFTEKNHQIDLNRRVVEWFVKYLTKDGRPRTK